MTLIAVLSGSNSAHLISDSLVTYSVGSTGEPVESEWLSTGVLLKNEGEIRYKFSESSLKIWPIQPNLAIALAGDVRLATNVLEMIVDHSRIEPLRSYQDLDQFLRGRVINSISPFRESCVLCGYIEDGGRITKYKITLSEESDLCIEHTTDPKVVYYSGSGEEELLEILRRLKTDYTRPDIDPSLLFSVFAEHFYLKQFFQGEELITNKFFGGAIFGVYCSENRTAWQPSRSVIIFANKGGTGLAANFQWQPWVYKTWSEGDKVFSSSMIEQNGRYYQRITQYTNPLSPAIHISPDTLTKEMKTFNAQKISAILLPKGLNNEFPAVLHASGRFPAFDEIPEGGRIAGIRLNKDFAKRLAGKFFVCDDYNIRICFNRFPPLIDALKKKLESQSEARDPHGWAQTQGILATALIEFGGNTNNIGLLKEALSRLLYALKTAKRNNLELVSDIEHDIRQFIKDINKNLKEEQIKEIISSHSRILESILRQEPEVES